MAVGYPRVWKKDNLNLSIVIEPLNMGVNC